MEILKLTPEEIRRRQPELEALLADSVEHGASIGFTLPLSADEVGAYWRKVCDDVAAGTRLLLAAVDEGGRIAGSAQLALETRANGRHRAEVQKVMVFAAGRERGTGAALMRRLEDEARNLGRTLLHLDTSVGSGGAGRFYEKLEYTCAGGIPDFAADPDGTLKPNAIYFKRLAAAAPQGARPAGS